MIIPTKLLISTKLAVVLSSFNFISVLGCGQFPQGQVSAMTFSANGFTLPAEMAYSGTASVQTLISTISHSEDAAQKFIKNLIMNAVNDVLQEQGRNALLPDAVISVILQQLNVSIEYKPLNCVSATNEADNMNDLVEENGCFIIGGMVVTLCAMKRDCKISTGMHLKAFPEEHRMLRGSLRTSNIIMANWSRQMWQSILNRVSRRLSTGQYEKFFSTAVVAVN